MVVRSQDTRRSARDDRVRAYFYGKKLNLYPHTFEVKFADIKIFKIGGKSIKIKSCLRLLQYVYLIRHMLTVMIRFSLIISSL